MFAANTFVQLSTWQRSILPQAPCDPEFPDSVERQKEEQKLIDEAEPLTEQESAEKEKLLQEVRHFGSSSFVSTQKPFALSCLKPNPLTLPLPLRGPWNLAFYQRIMSETTGRTTCTRRCSLCRLLLLFISRV